MTTNDSTAPGASAAGHAPSSDEALLRMISEEVNAADDAKEITDKLRENAKAGDIESLNALVTIGQRAREEKLRKELFGA